MITSAGDMGTLEPMRRLGVHMYVYRDEEQWAWAIAVSIAAVLRRELEQHDRARLLVSGGSSPAPVYQALSKAPLDWSRIDVALIDERWLQPDDPDSNAHLVRTTLAQNGAAAARYETLTRAGRGIDEAVKAANMHAKQMTTLALLGMGEDGHTASLFPRMRGLSDALESPSHYVAVDASGCAGAGRWLRRISLTPAGLAATQTRMLLIRGERKREVFERALDGNDACELPVRIAFTTPGASLDVHWCP
ncbi:MAG: 6-phosphogluconolactonase [Luteimonas sp.]